jgi:putative ABC transport system substrate-binding protein
VPIVFSAVTNPVISGISPSWQGGRERVAGNSNWLDRGRMLDVFRQAVPRLRRLAIIRSPDNAVSAAELEEARLALPQRPDLEIVELVVSEVGQLDAVLDRSLAGVDAIWLPIDYDLYQPEPLARLVARARAARKPVVSSISRAAGAGALVTLTVDYRQLGLKASSIVRRVLEGEAPGEIEIGRMRSTRLHVDLGAARAIGLELPIDLLLDAHEIVGREDER